MIEVAFKTEPSRRYSAGGDILRLVQILLLLFVGLAAGAYISQSDGGAHEITPHGDGDTN